MIGESVVVDLRTGTYCAGADPNRTTRAGGATALHRACYMGHTAVAEAL